MQRPVRFSFGYYLAMFAAIFLLQSMLFSGYKTKEIAYSQFRSWIAEGRVEDAVITEGKIVGELKEPEEAGKPDGGTVSPPSKQTPWHLSTLWNWITRTEAEIEAARARARAEEERHGGRR